MRESVQFGSREIVFDLEYSERKTLGISVSPEMEVVVKAPLDARLEKIKERIVLICDSLFLFQTPY